MMSARSAHFLTEAVGAASTIAAARRLRMFQELAAGPLTPAELAARCELAEPAAERLAVALASIGVVDRDGGRYCLPVDWGVVESQSELWGRLPEVVRGGATAGFDEALIAAGEYPALVGFIRTLAEAPARRAAPLLAADLQAEERVLEVGAGSAVWSLALVAEHPSCQVTALDLPPVLEVTRRSVKNAGRTDRYRFLAGDVFVDDFGGPYDLALIANVVHLFGEARATELFTRVGAALRPGGRLAVIDVMPYRGGPSRRAALHDLSLLLRTTDGAVHPYASYTKWLRRAGLEPVARRRLDPHWEMTLVTASRAPHPDTVAQSVGREVAARGGRHLSSPLEPRDGRRRSARRRAERSVHCMVRVGGS